MLWVLEELSCPQFEDGRGAQWRCAGVESNVLGSTQATVAAIADEVAAHQQREADEIQLRERATHVGERRKCFQSPTAETEGLKICVAHLKGHTDTRNKGC